VNIMSKLADLANNTAQLSSNLTGQAAENALAGALELGNQVAGMMHNASNILDRDAASNTAPSPKTPTEKAAALNNLDDINRRAKANGGEIIPTDRTSAAALGTPIDESFLANDGDDIGIIIDDNEERDFVELTIQDGTDEIHLNHFIAYFEYPLEDESIRFTSDFLKHFTKIFNPQNIATASFESEHKYKGNDTIRFKLGGEGSTATDKMAGFCHSDWISIELTDDKKTFFARTLKREFNDVQEDYCMRFAFPLLESVVELNKQHFLAGRRSWKVGFDEEMGKYYVETTAMERYSHAIHEILEDVGDFPNQVRKIWKQLILNFLEYFDVDILTVELDGYDSEESVLIRMENIDYGQNPQIPEWFESIMQAHSGLDAPAL
ncbi:MAG: hypothetical protein AAFO82_19450, partial [Bacteroidota bacterium]